MPALFLASPFSLPPSCQSGAFHEIDGHLRFLRSLKEAADAFPMKSGPTRLPTLLRPRRMPRRSKRGRLMRAKCCGMRARAGQWLGGDRRKADPRRARCGLPRRDIGPCEGTDTWWNQCPDEGLSARVILEDHVVLFQCAVWLIDWLELFALSYRKLSRSCAALRMTSLSSMFACARAIHAAHHSM